MRSLRLAFSFAAAGLLACSSGETGSTTTTTHAATGGTGGGVPDAGPIGGDRPVDVLVPQKVKPGTPAPLVILLHGYSVNGNIQELYFQLSPLAEKYGFLYAHPDGTVDEGGKHFWNATNACCNFDGSTVDDSAYISSLIDEIKARYDVDPKRVYLVGHSNGGFMSYRMACDHADQIAAIASLAGAMWKDVSKCTPKEPVSVLQMHGTADPEILFEGTSVYPSADETASDWATFDGCSPAPDTSAPPLDLDGVIAGDETKVTRWTGCKPGTAVELWAIEGGGHIPNLTMDAHEKMIEFLFAHPKP